MYKPLSDSTLMSMSKKEIIEQLRIAEHNHEVCEETINQQYENFQKLLADERVEAIDELLNNVSESIIWDILAEIMKRNIGASDGTDKIIEYLQNVAEHLKEH